MRACFSNFGLSHAHCCFFHQGQAQVGLVSDDLQTVRVLDLPLADRELGALTLVDRLSRGEALPALGAQLPLAEVQLRAPLPHPRRNIFVSVKLPCARQRVCAQRL